MRHGGRHRSVMITVRGPQPPPSRRPTSVGADLSHCRLRSATERAPVEHRRFTGPLCRVHPHSADTAGSGRSCLLPPPLCPWSCSFLRAAAARARPKWARISSGTRPPQRRRRLFRQRLRPLQVTFSLPGRRQNRLLVTGRMRRGPPPSVLRALDRSRRVGGSHRAIRRGSWCLPSPWTPTSCRSG